MSIRGIILDVSGTTIKSNGMMQEGLSDLLSFCRRKNLRIAFTTNEKTLANAVSNLNLDYDLLVTPNEVGIKKPSPAFIDFIARKLNVPKEKFVYVGDNDRTDAFCAAHAKILYFSAKWANAHAQYGIPVSCPHDLIKIINSFFLKNIYWGWKLDRTDLCGRSIRALSLLDCRSSLKDYAKRALKQNNTEYLLFFLLHLVSSIYLSGEYKEVDFWATYPSSRIGNSLNPTMSWIIEKLTKEFRERYVDLFQRHTQAMDSGSSRFRGVEVSFSNQINTVIMNPDMKAAVRNKKILVLDDFITKGYSQECARNLLYQAGASSVISISIGKYWKEKYMQISIDDRFDPCIPLNSRGLRISPLQVSGEMDDRMRDVLESSFNACIFRGIPAGHSNGSRPPIPNESGH